MIASFCHINGFMIASDSCAGLAPRRVNVDTSGCCWQSCTRSDSQAGGKWNWRSGVGFQGYRQGCFSHRGEKGGLFPVQKAGKITSCASFPAVVGFRMAIYQTQVCEEQLPQHFPQALTCLAFFMLLPMTAFGQIQSPPCVSLPQTHKSHMPTWPS